MSQIFGVLGHPIAHSLSPVMFEAAFWEYNIDATCEKYDVAPDKLNNFLDEARTKPVSGLSVTIPHKEAILPLLDVVDDKAKLIGAVNTVVNVRGKLKGYNTDWIGAERALEDVTSLEGKRVLVIGAGGAAAAIVYACFSAGARVTILNRHVEKARELAERFSGSQISVDSLNSILSHPSDVLIHTTSIGMSPNIHESIVPSEYLKKGMVVMDIVYIPLETRLVKEAKRAGCKIVPGFKMLLYQAEKQFELWFKKKPPTEKMERALVEALTT